MLPTVKRLTLIVIYVINMLGLFGCDSSTSSQKPQVLTFSNGYVQASHINYKPYDKDSGDRNKRGFQVTLSLKDLSGREIFSNYVFVGPIKAVDNLGNAYISEESAYYDKDFLGKSLPGDSVFTELHFKPEISQKASFLDLIYQIKPNIQYPPTIFEGLVPGRV